MSDTSTSVQDAKSDASFPCATCESASTSEAASSHTFNDDEDESPHVVNKGIGKAKEVHRGRSREREPRYPNPLARAESSLRESQPAIEIDIQPIEKRHLSRSGTFFDDPNDPCAALDDSLLEPCPHIPICNSVSEIVNTPISVTHPRETLSRNSLWKSAGVPTGQVPLSSPIVAISTVYSDCRKLAPEPLIPHESSAQLFPSTENLEYLATKASWSVPPRKGSKLLSLLASKLPTEVLQNIYYNLAPADFNAARHSCRSWFIGSLNKTLLMTMLERGGFSSSVGLRMTEETASLAEYKINMEWLLSKRLARECALGPDWTGNGLSTIEEVNFGDLKKPGLVHISTTDFTEVSVHCTANSGVGTLFTISSCGKFLIAANGCLIYIYELNHSYKNAGDAQLGALRPVTSIICPHRVIATSMDTSSHRYSIAILMDGRMGLVCDIKTSNLLTMDNTNCWGKKAATTTTDVPQSIKFRGTSFLDRTSLNSSASASSSCNLASEAPFVFPGITACGATYSADDKGTWEDVFKGDMPESTRTAGPSSRHTSLSRPNVLARDFDLTPQVEIEKTGDSSMRVETGPRSLYRNLCSDDDPPRSVAICPQRRCVAFGCSSGIELHWVDALTGQDLNRWFPLTAPSDFLFFLPPRRNVDSAKKLRLISSAARPSERPAIAERVFGQRSRSSPFWEKVGWGMHHLETNEEDSLGTMARMRGGNHGVGFSGRMECSDHYRAVPLSDGNHILFTDPATGLLCLGSDAPVGGPMKLLRKIWFQGPEGNGSPVAYSGGSDLTWGVRVVAGFGAGPQQTIWLFSVPRDVFTTTQTVRSTYSSTPLPRFTTTEQATRTEWVNWWTDDGLKEWLNHVHDPVPGIVPRSVWPVKVRGQMIGTCNGLVDLAVDSGPDMAVWAFSKEGIATVWRMDDGRSRILQRYCIARDGTVRAMDSDDDVEMSNAPPITPDILCPPLPLSQESFDGSSSFVYTTRSERCYPNRWRQQIVEYDFEGDVLMDDMTDYPSDEDLFDETVIREFEAGERERSERRSVRDLVEELTGIARVEVEIR